MKIVIIGGVAAGMSAAVKAKRLDKESDITVYDKDENVSWGACGLPYFVGGFYDDKSYMVSRTIDELTKKGISVKVKHEVISINTKDKVLKVKNLVTGKVFNDSYDKLMISTGASSIIPPIKNVDFKNVFTLKTLDDGDILKEALNNEENKEVVIIGAGFIGLEVAEASKRLGKNIRIIQLSDSVLDGTFDKDIANIIQDEIVSHDSIKLNLSEIVKEIEGNKQVEYVKTNKGKYKADIVVIATGVRPSTAFLKDTELKMLKNGAIVINQYGQTNIEDIYSAGDCASVYHIIKNENVYIPLGTTANKIGRIVGENIVGNKKPFAGTLGSAAVKVLDLECARTGITEEEAIKMNIDYSTSFVKDKNQTNYYPGQEDICVKLVYNPKTKVILGGQIVGKNGAVLRIDVLVSAIFKKMTTDELGMLDLCYAPPFSRTWDVLNVSGNVSKGN